jgi:curved DNA-binding protein CbpA
MKDLYSVLGVNQGASSQAIKTAFRELAKEYHPDINLGDREAEDRIKEINYAYTVLSDFNRRAAYDGEISAAAARTRKTAFMNAAMVAAGFLALTITGASATLLATSWHRAQPPQQVRYAVIGVPERAMADYDPAEFQASNETTVAKLPSLPWAAPTEEVEHAALMVIAPVKASKKEKLHAEAMRRDAAPVHASAKKTGRRAESVRIDLVAGGVASAEDGRAPAETAAWFALQ